MDRWLFVHVMKTAGTSFRLMLEEQFDQDIYPTKEELKKLRNGWYLRPDELLARIHDGQIDLERRRIICGHYAVNLRDRLPGRWRTVVFLREPVARSLSMIAHSRRHGTLYERKLARTSHWLRKQDFVANLVENYQTKVLAMDGTGNVNRACKVDREIFAQARRNLETIDLVGLTEQFAESVALFDAMSGMRFSHRIVHANKAPGRAAAVDERDVEAIRRLVPYDLELYELVREKLGDRLRAAGADTAKAG
jgi:hypothetical protein